MASWVSTISFSFYTKGCFYCQHFKILSFRDFFGYDPQGKVLIHSAGMDRSLERIVTFLLFLVKWRAPFCCSLMGTPLHHVAIVYNLSCQQMDGYLGHIPVQVVFAVSPMFWIIPSFMTCQNFIGSWDISHDHMQVLWYNIFCYLSSKSVSCL